ncbi:MAG TPA: cytochrome c oxidase assembly protein, partial [Rheinheimera sp.]|uniref:cytochrome c oxidase assembly protein n=1 Tax=Rheinheimera sp. TaxID=1869214 RepID=UPI002F933F84
IECFCFTQQRLAGGKDMLMPLQFYVDPALPRQFSTITLSYTLYDVTSTDLTATSSQLGE